MTEKSKIARTAGVVSGATLLSRLAGLGRDLATSYFFGTSAAAAAFVVAFRIPNLFRRLLAEGALTVAFVPVFTQTLQAGGPREAGALFRRMFTLLALALALLSLLGLVFAPQIVALMAPGFQQDPEKFRLTVFLTRILFPYIFFMGLGALFMGALNSLGYFAAPALGPFMGNLAMIGGTILLSPHLERPILGLCCGALAGGALQLGIQLPSLRQAGLSLAPDFNFRSPALKRILYLMGPAALGAAVYQLSVFINTILGSFLPEGSIPYLYYADRLMQFPLGIFTVAIGTAALPALARQSARGDQEGFIDSARFALGLSFFITVPAMAGLAALAQPLVGFLFERGAFTPESTRGTAETLQAFVLGLPFLSGAGILARIFYSRSNTRTPTLAAAGSLAVGALAALILMWPLQHVGLALASSISSTVNFFWLYGLLLARERAFPQKEMLLEVLSYFLLAAVMGAAVWPLGRWALASAGFWPLTLKTLGAVSAGMAVYFLLSLLSRRPHVAPLLDLIKRALGKLK
ncbi:MAG: murein biosynthesis integral membrane protein MurJ [Candidatus Adiutrix sp.]|jgi:putative peptidoglycan lipid II flippase|nr:murein biosynthesis integral membrane protein MurJ [Candidatus Adiutrix sp.]